jgi:hypothetical protein
MDSLVLNIGGDVGALVVHAPAELVEHEVEVSPLEALERRTHTVVHTMAAPTETGVAHIGVIPELAAGHYVVWGRGDTVLGEVEINGGSVTEFRWPEGVPAPKHDHHH